MDSSHVAALQAKHEGLERRIHEELTRPAPDSTMIQTLKKQKLRIKEELSFSLFERQPASRRRACGPTRRPSFPKSELYDRRLA